MSKVSHNTKGLSHNKISSLFCDKLTNLYDKIL